MRKTHNQTYNFHLVQQSIEIVNIELRPDIMHSRHSAVSITMVIERL